MGELPHDLVELGVYLLVNDGLRQLEVDLLQRGLEHLVADCGGLLGLLVFLDLALDRLAQLVDGVVLGSELGEIIVKLRQLTLLSLLDVDLDGGFLALALAGLELGGELVVLVGLHATQGGVEALDQGVIANAVVEALGGGVLDLLAVHLNVQVDDREVAGLHLALGVLELTEALLQAGQLLVDVVLGDLDGRDGDVHLAEVRHLDLRADVDLGGELDEVLVFDLGDVHVRLADDLEIVFLHGLLVAGRQHVVDYLLEDRAAAEAGIDKLARCLALTKARDLHLLCDGCVSLVDLIVELRERNVDGELDAGVAQLVDGGLHE